jgi:hypothetical protein
MVHLQYCNRLTSTTSRIKLVSMLRFIPPANSTCSEIYPGKGWVSVGWQRFDKWRAGRGYREISRDLGCALGLLTQWKQGQTPAPEMLAKLEKLADVPPIAWQHWICIDPAKAYAASKALPKYQPSPYAQGYAVDFVKAVRGALSGRPDADTLEHAIMSRYTALSTNRERARRARFRAAAERRRSKR